MKIFRYEMTDSTNTRAREYAKSENPTFPAVFIADGQTNGRGRRGRSFNSERGSGLYVSFLFKPHGAASDAVRITLRAAVALCRALSSVCGLEAEIKWVNDIQLGGRKICGISCEAISAGEKIEAVILGIGVNFSAQEFPEDLKDSAGVLFEEPAVTRNVLIAEILKNLLHETSCMTDRKFIDEYRRRSAVLGKPIRYLEDGLWYEAEAEGIDENGGLIVREVEGLRTLVSGEITLRIK